MIKDLTDYRAEVLAEKVLREKEQGFTPGDADLRVLSDYVVKSSGPTDSLGDMGDELSLKLQMAQERRAKFYATLSNIMKKSSDTSAGIVANMK